MIVVLKDRGGPVRWYPRDADGNPRRPDAGPTVQALDENGGEIVPAGTAATLDAVDTTLASGVASGAMSLQLTSGTGVEVGVRYVVASPYEEVEVSRVSGNTAYLVGPTWYAHPSAAPFQGHRVTCTLSAAQAAREVDHARVLFSWALSAAAQARGQVDFAIARNLPTCPIGPVDLLRADPDLRRKLSAQVDVNALIRTAFDEVMEDLSAGGVWSYDYVGSERLRRATVYKALHLAAEHFGPRFQGERDRLWDRYRQSLAAFRSITASDVDRDGAVSASEQNIAARRHVLVRS